MGAFRQEPVYRKRGIIDCENGEVGRAMIGAGVMLVLLGGLVILMERFGVRLGRLPGDIVMRGRGGTFYFPVVTCLVVSVVVSLILWVVGRR